jgi:hypothetical protein
MLILLYYLNLGAQAVKRQTADEIVRDVVPAFQSQPVFFPARNKKIEEDFPLRREKSARKRLAFPEPREVGGDDVLQEMCGVGARKVDERSVVEMDDRHGKTFAVTAP